MKKTFTFWKSLFLLFALIVGSTNGWGQTFSKITSISEVSNGCSYILVYENGDNSVAMSTTQNSNNRAKIDVTINDNTITYTSGVEVVTLESTGTANQYYLRGINGKYLIAVSKNNYLRSSDTKVDAGKFTFAYSENVLSITSTLPAGNTSTWNPSQLRYNYSTGDGGQVFSCYGTGQGAITLYKENVVSWENSSKGIDVLTYGRLNLQGNSGAYRDFIDVSSNPSASYAGNAYKSNIDYIQLRKQTPSGIVTTKSGGNVRKIVIDWNASTSNTDGRYVEIYGKQEAYSSGADLYGDSKGTLLGTIKYGTSTELRVFDDYSYIGILASAPVFIKSVTIYWEGDAVSLSDASDYTPVAKDYAKVTLNRKFVAGWNGIILPFDLTDDVMTALGASEVKTLDKATVSAGVATLSFEDTTLPVAAGTPVLVKLGAAKESGDVVLNGVELKTTTPTTVEKTVDGNTFALTGTYREEDLAASEVYLVSNKTFYHKATGTALTAKPFRSYIVQSAVAGAHLINVNFDLEGGSTTGIVEISTNSTKDNNQYYDLQGRKVVKPNKGIYIVNGKKFVIK